MRDPHEFERLYERSYEAIFRAVYVMSRNRQVAEDATQEAFARALARWWRLSRVDWAEGWVARTALNAARRELRHRQPQLSGASVYNDESGGMLLDLHRALASLPKRQQETIVMHYIVDLPVTEVAKALGIAEGTVKTHLFRAREALREAMVEGGVAGGR